MTAPGTPLVHTLIISAPAQAFPIVVQEIPGLIAKLQGLGLQTIVPAIPSVDDTTSKTPHQDDVESISTPLRLWVQGLREQARPLVKLIAQHAPSYSWGALRKAVGLTGREVSGRLSSGGHQTRRVRALGYDFADPIQRDWQGGRYLMDPATAEQILQLLAQEGEV